MQYKSFFSRYTLSILILLSMPLRVFSQSGPTNIWDAAILRDATPKVKTTYDYRLNGKVRLVVENRDSLYFDPQERITRERKAKYGKATITTYEYDDYGHLTRENLAEYNLYKDGSISYEPDNTYETHWEYDRKGYLWRRILMTTGVEKEQFQHATYTTLKDTVVVRYEVKDQLQETHTGWENRYDFEKGIRNKYEWDFKLGDKKTLVETVNFDTSGNVLKTIKFIGGQPMVVYLRQETPEGHISSLYEYDDNAKLRFEEKTIYKGQFKQNTKYYLPDSNQIMQLSHTKVFNEKGEAIADSLHYCGIVQQYYFKSGNPDFLQINTDNKGNVVWRNETRYNQKGYIIYRRSERGGDITEEKYDDNWNMVYYKDSSSNQKSQYVYDKHGNWIKATYSGTLFKTHNSTRSVFYYP